MVGRPGVTEKEVLEAIAALQEMSARVTVESIRFYLGRGSPNTINRHLRSWREKSAIDINLAFKCIIKRLDVIDLKLQRLCEKGGIRYE
jgi:colicin import membrane protein